MSSDPLTARTTGKPFRTAINRTLEELEVAAQEGIVSQMLLDTAQKAAGGDDKARYWILNRSFPVPKDSLTPLPGLDMQLTLSEQMGFIIEAMVTGRIRPSDGLAYSTVIERRAKVVEIDDLVKELHDIRAIMAERGLTSPV